MPTRPAGSSIWWPSDFPSIARDVPVPSVVCTDWFGGLGNLALPAEMKAKAFPTPEIFLSTIFLSKLGIGTGKFGTGKFLGPDPGKSSFLSAPAPESDSGRDRKKQGQRCAQAINKCSFLGAHSPKPSFGPDREKQGCHRSGVRESTAVITPRGKLHTDATMVLSSPFKSLVLEAVLTVIGGESAQASGSDPVQEITQLFPPSGPPRR